MAIPSSLLKPIYIAYALGSDGSKVVYDKPIKIHAQIDDVKSLILREQEGIIKDYDRIILVPYGEKTQYIDEQTLLWINIEPNLSYNNSDYKIERVGDIVNGNFVLYCNSLTANTKSIYYERNKKIYQIKIDFDNRNMVAFLPLNKYFPVSSTTKIWVTKPSSIENNTNLIKLIKKERCEKSYKLTFEKVE